MIVIYNIEQFWYARFIITNRKVVKFMSELANIPWNLIMPLIVLQFILMIVALVDVIRHRRTNGPFIMWIFIIVLGNLIGSILYFIFGRRQV